MIVAKFNKIKDAIINIFDKKNQLIYVVETNDWIIRWVGEHVVGNLSRSGLIQGRVSTSAAGLKNKIIHFGSINSFLGNGSLKNKKNNKIVLSWFHVVPGDERLKYIAEINERIDLVATSCQATKKELLAAGLRKEKIVVIPLGVDLNDFRVLPSAEKEAIKIKLGLASSRITIGSFQKDGNGWGEGLEPKLIKGPDIFCDVMERLAKKHPLQVLLTGPARGYVKNRLTAAGIPFVHKIFKTQKELNECYNCLDLYLIASRVEGGPEALVESWATAVPVVSTRMGMPADVVRDGENGILAEVNDVAGLAAGAEKILTEQILREKLINNALSEVNKYSWEKLAGQYYEEIYHKLQP
ncbi:MAG TPA: glycosyltransferase family 4 protein [Candidatus Methylomirabilis sp.]|nr:glycosyltransferase family 4 protein [Candidatus Methylomirabilis sp.]